MREKDRPVYNEQQKLDFIHSTTASDHTANVTIAMFRAIAPFEFEKSADISTFEEEDLSNVLDQVCGMRTRSRHSKISIFRKYIHWCIENGMPDAKDCIDRISAADTGRISISLVRNPEHLQVRLDQIFDPESDETQDNTIRFYFWMAYGGMPEDRILQLTRKNISFEYMEAKIGDSTAVIYRQALPAIRNCISLTQFVYRNQAYVNLGQIMRDRAPGDELIRGIRGKPNVLNMRSQISKKIRLKQLPVSITKCMTYGRVWLSGVFYRMYENERAGIEPDFASLALASYSGSHRSSDSEFKQSIAVIESGLKIDYEKWKQNNATNT